MKIAIIGAGNMGGAVARGWHRNCPEVDVTLSAIHREKLDRIKNDCPEYNVTVNNRQAVDGADMIVIAVKPWQVAGVIDEVKDLLSADKILVSFAGGISLDQLQQMTDGCRIRNLFCAIPNIAAEFCESMTFVSASEGAEKGAVEMVDKLFGSIGRVFFCQEKQMVPGMLMASCGIAYVLRFLRAQSEAGVEMGFYPEEALKIAIQTMKGAAALLNGTGEHPEAAIDRVTTPGGFTVKGLNEMDHTGFSSSVIKVFKTGFEK